ncbi:LLM class flavin-dependent oxidoreductase [Novosphingobium resinovorum]
MHRADHGRADVRDARQPQRRPRRVHVITGANDTELECDGDFHTKEERYHRSAEYVEIMRKVWSSGTPVDHNGTYYRFNSALSELKPVNGAIPVYWGGSSPLALEKGAEVADVYAIGGLKPLDQMAGTVAQIRDAWGAPAALSASRLRCA